MPQVTCTCFYAPRADAIGCRRLSPQLLWTSVPAVNPAYHRLFSMARRHHKRSLSGEFQHFVRRLAPEYGADRDATFRSLQHLTGGLPFLQASAPKISPRTRLRFAFEILENAYSALGSREARRVIRRVELSTLERGLRPPSTWSKVAAATACLFIRSKSLRTSSSGFDDSYSKRKSTWFRRAYLRVSTSRADGSGNAQRISTSLGGPVAGSPSMIRSS